jgi:hypothetical protein
VSKDKKQTVKEIITANQHLDYAEIAALTGQSKEAVRKMYRRMGLPPKRDNEQAKHYIENLSGNDIKPYIKTRKRTIEEIADHYNAPPYKIREALEELQDSHHVFDVVDDKIVLGKDIAPNYKPIEVNFSKHAEQEIPIGFVADNHLGSKYERLDILEDLYDRFAKEGVRTVYQGGNILDGEARFNKFDIYVHGLNAQVNNLVEKWPKRKGIKTLFITGDDHEGWYVQREHINIGEVIEWASQREGRDDLVHLGYMERDVVLQQPDGSAILRVIHAGGGSAYAHSYTAQKYAESLQGGEKPRIVLVGHYHKYNHSYPREIHIIQGGCTQDQTPFMRKRKLQAMTGGVILWVKQASNGIIRSVKVEWMPYFDKKYYEYRW